MARRKKETSIYEDIAKLLFIFVALLFLTNRDKTIFAFKVIICPLISLIIILVVIKYFIKIIEHKKINALNTKDSNVKTKSVDKPYCQINCDIPRQAILREKSVRAQSKRKKETNNIYEPQNIKIIKDFDNTTETIKNIWTIEFLKSIEWKRFEELCVKYFKIKNYNAELTGLGADDGVDIKIYDEKSPMNLHAIVQCKSYTSYKIGVKLIRELYGVMKDKEVDVGIFITTSNFTNEAIKFAKGKKIQLINGQTFVDKINNIGEDQLNQLYNEITTGDYTTPSCPKCGCKMLLRKNRNNFKKIFWGCQNYPRCRFTMRCNKDQEMGS